MLIKMFIINTKKIKRKFSYVDYREHNVNFTGVNILIYDKTSFFRDPL
jgi:hypothetical protein